MIDTGNMLKEPITGNPVIVVEKEVLKSIISEEILENAQKIIGGDNEIELEDKKIISKFRVIPFSSIGKQNGLLLGFKPDEINIINNESEKRFKNVVVAIYNKSFSKNKTYRALIGLDIIERSEENEYIRNNKK